MMGAYYVGHLLKVGALGVHGLRSQKMLAVHGVNMVLYLSKARHVG